MTLMKAFSCTLTLSALIVSSSGAGAATPEEGKLRIAANKSGAYIYVNDKKKSMIGDEGFTTVLLAEGDYNIRVEKKAEDDKWVYKAERSVFVGANTSLKLSFELKKYPSSDLKVILERSLDLKGFGSDRYLDSGDGTVFDKKTQLTWKKCSEGMSGTSCGRGELKKFAWEVAVSHAEQAEFAGHSDWRLPTRLELDTLVFCSTGRQKVEFNSNGKLTKHDNKWNNGECLGEGYDRPTINSLVFPNAAGTYHSTSQGRFDFLTWVISFKYGANTTHLKEEEVGVRLVRNEK